MAPLLFSLLVVRAWGVERGRGGLDGIGEVESGDGWVFASDTTYVVRQPVRLSGTVVFEPGTVVKFARGVSASIELAPDASLVWLAEPYRPVVMTAVDDDTAGARLPGSTGQPGGRYASAALVLGERQVTARIQHLSIRHAALALDVRGAGSNGAEFWHLRFHECGAAVRSAGRGGEMTRVRLRNALVDRGEVLLENEGGADLRVEHATIAHLGAIARERSGVPGRVALLNCLLYEVQDQGRAVLAGTESAGAGDFVEAGGEGYYLAATSRHRKAAGKNAGIAEELARLTTWAPLPASGGGLPEAVLRPSVSLDGGMERDRGYHHWPVDYRVGDLRVAAGEVLLTNGVVVEVRGAFGWRVEGSGKVVSRGDLGRLNRIVRAGGVLGGPVVVMGAGDPARDPAPVVDFRETFLVAPAGPAEQRTMIRTDVDRAASVVIRDCVMQGAGLSTDATRWRVSAINNVWLNAAVHHRGGLEWFNNLVQAGSLRITEPHGRDAGGVAIRNNLFDGTLLTFGAPVRQSHNAYAAGTAPSGGGEGDRAGLEIDFVAGARGTFYYPEQGGPASLRNLVDAGFGTPAELGLYHHTTSTNQTPEAGTRVDIGFHALRVNDTDRDGIPDVREDINGNGVRDPLETDWKLPDTDGDSLHDGLELLAGSDPFQGNRDGDCNFDAHEVGFGTNPVDPGNDIAGARRLGYWRFEGDGLEESSGVRPLAGSGAERVDSFDGRAVAFPAGGRRVLGYPVQAGRRTRSFDPAFGTVRMVYVADWARHGVGDRPGDWCTLFEGGLWRLAVDPEGRFLCLLSTTSSGQPVTLHRVSLPRRTEGRGREGWDVSVSYGPGASWIHIDQELAGGPAGTLGLGVPFEPARAAAVEAFHMGSNRDGSQPARGFLDEVETFNVHVDRGALPEGASVNLVRDWNPSIRRRTGLWASDESAGLKLRWLPEWAGDWEADAGLYAIERRMPGGNWAVLASGIRRSEFVDETARPGEAYEYRVRRRHVESSPVLRAVWRRAEAETAVRVLVLVDDTVYSGRVRRAVDGYVDDLMAEGWEVSLVSVPRQPEVRWSVRQPVDSEWVSRVRSVRSVIEDWHGKGPGRSRAVVLVGHVAVPYSGTAAEDGHQLPQDCHLGAWPADAYYGDLDGEWTDTGRHQPDIQDPLSARAGQLQNVPGDGKWDQNVLPANRAGERRLEVAVGRIDFDRLPWFSGDASRPSAGRDAELVLLERYLDKVRRYRRGELVIPNTMRYAMMSPGFVGTFRNAERCAREAVGVDLAGTWWRTVDTNTVHGWVLHGGNGTIECIGIGDQDVCGVHTICSLGLGTFQAVGGFYCLESSWHADWNLGENSLARGALAARDAGLALIWDHRSSRPWAFSALGEGGTLGDLLVATFAEAERSCRTTYILGDPMLRMQVVRPPEDVRVVRENGDGVVTWKLPPGPVAGVHVFLADSSGRRPERRLTEAPVMGTRYRLPTEAAAGQTYVVRAVAPVSVAVGSIERMSLGVASRRVR